MEISFVLYNASIIIIYRKSHISGISVLSLDTTCLSGGYF